MGGRSLERINIGFLASHGGSNMQAVLDAITSKKLNANPCILISNNSKAMAIDRANRFGMPFSHLSLATHPDPDHLDIAILETLKYHQVEYVLLVGYMKKLGPKTLHEYRNRIINIHPSLLPKYGGKGMFGRKVHETVLANQESETGVTVHLVDEEYDTGRIINQVSLPILAHDTIDSLNEKVIQKEHEILVETFIKIYNQEIIL